MFALSVGSGSRHICFAAIVLAAVPLSGQPSLDPSQPPAQEPASAAVHHYQLELPVPLVIEDVVVVDAKVQPVHDLKASDFAVTENGKRVEIRNFEAHVSRSIPVAQAEPVKPPELGVNTFTNVPQIPPAASLNAVDKVLEYGENYYTITYTPPAQKFACP
jgi:hypothetical protein